MHSRFIRLAGLGFFYYDGEHQEGNGPQLPEEGLSSDQPKYDDNGNLTRYKAWRYRYDAQNRLVEAINGGQIVTFHYDGKNRQIARNVGGVIRFSAWDNWELVEEYASGLNTTMSYLQGVNGVIKSWGANGTFYYYQDKLGSTTHVANASGQLLESYKYDLYGTPTYYVPGDPNARPSSGYGIADLYAGERWIPELGLYDLRNRFMSPELGRFLQADPIGFKGDPSNLYRYCHNDPENFTDPMGLNPPSKEEHRRMLTSDGGGDWDFFNGRVALAQINLQQQQPAGNQSSPVAPQHEGKKGLKVQYASSYPSKGPGGRPVVHRAVGVLASKPHGRFLLGGRGVLTIHPTDKNNPLGIKGIRGNLRLYLNPKDSLFYDPETYRKIYRDNPGEKPPDSDAGRASVIGHELGHRFEEFDENMGGRNVRIHENAVRAEHGLEPRRSYGGHQFRVEQ